MKTYKLKNGVEVKVQDYEQLVKITNAFGEGVDLGQLSDMGISVKGYYKSDSKGLVKISEMNDVHIMNSVIKLMEVILSEVKSNRNNYASIPDFLNGLIQLTDDNRIQPLLEELDKRLKK